MKNNIFNLTAFTVGCIAATTGCVQKNNKVQQKQKPNIIFILADDLGYGDLGCYGQKLIKTPHIDKLAAEGIRFSQYYCGTSVSSPSRCSLLTGKHSGHAAIRGNKEAEPYGQFQLDDSIPTVADYLKSAGYTSANIGKWGMGVEYSSGDPKNHGFDYFFGYYCQVHAHNSFPEYLLRNGQKVPLQNKVVYMPKDHWTRGLGSYATEKKEFSNDLFVNDALRYIDSVKTKPFFLYLAFTLPHENGEAPKGLQNEIPSLDPYNNEMWTKDEKAYAAMISRLDSYVGRIMQKLSEAGIDSNTIVIFSSDNGATQQGIFKSNSVFRGNKRDMYEGGLRMPFIARWPGMIRSGRVSAYQIASWDFLPTACEIAEVKDADINDGISFLPALKDEKNKTHDYLYWELHEGKKSQAARMGKWKAIRNGITDKKIPAIELYDLSVDSSESNNIAKLNPEIVKKMEDILKKEHRSDQNWPLFPEEKDK